MTGRQGNPKHSKWRSPDNKMRGRPVVSVSLSWEAKDRLEELSEIRSKPKSVIVEELILKEPDEEEK